MLKQEIMRPITQPANFIEVPYLAFLATASAVLVFAGCAAAPAREGMVVAPPEPVEIVEEPAAVEADRIAADPAGFLREVTERTAELDQYRLTFYRQERFGRMGPMEEIRAAFRSEPFSVKFAWENEDMPYYESVYVEGQNRDQLIVRERKGALPFLQPTVRRMDVVFPVKINRSKNPITDFGLHRLMERTLLPLDDAQVAATTTIRYQGIVNLEPMNRPAHHIRIDRAKTSGIRYTHQDLYFDTETMLPAGTDLYLPGDVLDARYRYADIDTGVKLTDADFRLSRSHPDGDAGG